MCSCAVARQPRRATSPPPARPAPSAAAPCIVDLRGRGGRRARVASRVPAAGQAGARRVARCGAVTRLAEL